MSLNHRGVTLVEMAIAITLLVMVSGIALRLLLRQQWSADAQGQRAALQATLRSAAIYLETELRELGGDPGDPDILVFAPESLTYRAMRGTGLGCSLSATTLTVKAGDFFGYRAAQPGRDSLLLFFEGAEETLSDDRWIHLPLLWTGTTSCGGSQAQAFSTLIDTTRTPLSGFPPVVPFRSFEIMQVKLYQSAGDSWLGARSVSAAEIIQPFAGPFQPHGLALAAFDSLGGPTSSVPLVRSISIALRGITASAIRSGAGMGIPQRRSDSVTAMVMLRNW